jgi:phosphate:Na+ symporter
VLGVVIWLPFIGFLADLAIAASPVHPDLIGAARMAEEVPRQIANAHTIFNVANTLIFIWFTGVFAKVVEKMIPERIEVTKEIIASKYLDATLLATPMLAMEAARFESHRLGKIASEMVHEIGPALKSRDPKRLDELEKLDDKIDVLKDKIMEYLGEIYKQQVTTEEGKGLLRMMRGADEIQRIGTAIRNDMIPTGRVLFESEIEVSETTRHVLTNLYESVCAAVQLAVDAMEGADEAKALEVLQMKSTIHGLIDDALEYQQERISPTESHLITRFRLEDEIIDSLKRIYDLSKRIGNLVVPATVAARDV